MQTHRSVIVTITMEDESEVSDLLVILQQWKDHSTRPAMALPGVERDEQVRLLQTVSQLMDELRGR